MAAAICVNPRADMVEIPALSAIIYVVICDVPEFVAVILVRL